MESSVILSSTLRAIQVSRTHDFRLLDISVDEEIWNEIFDSSEDNDHRKGHEYPNPRISLNELIYERKQNWNDCYLQPVSQGANINKQSHV